MSDPSNDLGNPNPTHINAFKAELAQAEVEVQQAQGRVEALKDQIATMEAADGSPVDAPVETPAAVDSVADLEKLNRSDLEDRATEAGVESPEDAANKQELAQATVVAQADPTVGTPVVDTSTANQATSLAPDASTTPVATPDVTVSPEAPVDATLAPAAPAPEVQSAG